MADVQLEHGYVKLANRLVEAILDAEFTGAQVRILLALVRLTYGWRRKTVTLAVPALAASVRMSPVGGFRRALRELVEAGVVLQLEGHRGSLASTYAIQKDFTRWGRFSVAEARIAALWGDRPSHDDAMMPARPACDPTGSDDVTSQGHEADADDDAPCHPTGSDDVTLQGHIMLPARVTSTPRKSKRGTTVRVRKDSERHRKTVVRTRTKTTGGPTAGAPGVGAVLAHYRSLHPRRRPGEQDAKLVAKALASGYSERDLCDALDGNAADAWCQEKAKHELSYVLRNNGLIDGFREKATRARPAVWDVERQCLTDYGERVTRPDGRAA